MKTPEDEAFDELARKQGAWGGGFPAKRQMAMDKINSDFDEEYKKMHEDRIKYGTSWEQDGKRIDPMSVYKEPVTEREALKLALDALEEYADHEGKTRAADEAITAIKEALAQPAQEQWKCVGPPCKCNASNAKQCCYAVFTTPPQREWVGLTAEDTFEIGERLGLADVAWLDLMKAIEAKLKEKNT